MSIKFSDDQKKELVEKVDRLRKEGEKLLDACAKNKISFSNYYNWREAKKPVGKRKVKKMSRRKRVVAPSLLTIPVPDPVPASSWVILCPVNLAQGVLNQMNEVRA